MNKGRGSNKGESCFPRQQGGCVLSLLLGCHVDHQVHNTVAVSIFIIIPGDRKQVLSGLAPLLPFFLAPLPHPKTTELPPTLGGRKEAATVISGKKQSHSTVGLEPLYTTRVLSTWITSSNQQDPNPSPVCASPRVPQGCTYQETSLTKWSFSAMPAPASKVEEWLSPLKSQETT